MTGVVGRVGGWWKAAAGCAICASLVAGVINDARIWVWDHTVGLVWTERASFDTCLDRHLTDTARPEAEPAFHVLVTVPRGDDDLTQFHAIERSLTRVYGETHAAPVQVEALACHGLQPAGGMVADVLVATQTRAQGLLEKTGADVVIWGEVLVAGKEVELRFAVPESTEKPTSYVIDRMILAPGFGADIGALVASKALTSIRDHVGPTLDGQQARADLAIAITQPLIETLPPGLSDGAQADLYLAHGLALSMGADLRQGAGRYDASSAMLQRAVERYDPAEKPREWRAAKAALIANSVYATADLPQGERAVALSDAVKTVAGFRADPVAAADPAFAAYLRGVEAGTLVMLAADVPEAAAATHLARAADLLLENIAAIDPAAQPLTMARAQIVYSMVAEQFSRAVPEPAATEALTLAVDAVRKALVLLPGTGESADTGAAEGWLAILLQDQALALQGDERIAMLEEAQVSMTASADTFQAMGQGDHWAAAQAELGRIRHQLGRAKEGKAGAADLRASIEASLAAQTVSTRATDLVVWAGLEMDQMVVEDACAENPACDSRKAALERALAHAVAAEAAFAELGDAATQADAAAWAESLRRNLAE